MLCAFTMLADEVVLNCGWRLCGQYMLGDDLLVSPVVNPANKSINMAAKSIWLPTGTWVEHGSGMIHVSDGSVIVTKNYDLREVPVFIKGGAVLPFRPISGGRCVARRGRDGCCCSRQ